MDELKVKLPTRLVNQLCERNIDDRKIHQTVIAALWQLTFKRPSLPEKPGEKFSDYIVRSAKEMRENAPYVGGMTWKEWMAMSDAEQEALWNKWHAEEGDDLDESGRNAKARITNTTRQKRRAKNARRTRESRMEKL